MKKWISRFMVLALAFTLAGSLSGSDALAASNKIIVKTKKQLIQAMAKKTPATIIFRTDRKTKFIIPELANPAEKKIVLQAPNARAFNKATFKTITLEKKEAFINIGKHDINITSKKVPDIEKHDITITSKKVPDILIEKHDVTLKKAADAKNIDTTNITIDLAGKGKTDSSSTLKADIPMDKLILPILPEKNIQSITIASEGSSTDVVNLGKVQDVFVTGNSNVNYSENGTTGNVYISSGADVSFSGTSKGGLNVTVSENAEGASVTSSIPLQLSVYSDMNLTLEKGAEGSEIRIGGENIAITIENNTDQTVADFFVTGTYTVSYILNNSSAFLLSENPTSYSADSSELILFAPVCLPDQEDSEGQNEYMPVFLGWYEYGTFEGPVTSIPAGSKGDKIFWAKWDMGVNHQHEYVATMITQATCTTAGITVTACSCGDFQVITNEAAKEHIPETIPATEPGCETPGWNEGKKCSVCGTVLLQGSRIPALGHLETADPGKPSTCKEKGLSAGSHCARCGNTIVPQEELPLADHTPAEAVQENLKAGTCKDPGCYDSVVYCSVCEKEISRETVETAKDETNHTGGTEIRNAMAATCTSDGYTGDTFCLGCGKQLETGKKTDRLGHSWGEVSYTWADNNSTCTAERVCANDSSHKESETVETGYSVTRPAGCETEGTGIYTAKFITNDAFKAQEKEAALAATGHSWGEVSYTWADDNSTCTAERVCTNDSSHRESETVDSVIDKARTQAPGCDTEGKTVYTATFSNTAFTAQVKEVTVDATGHDWPIEPSWEWNDDRTEAIATLICRNDESHVLQASSTDIRRQEIDPDPDKNEPGKYIFTTSVTFSELPSGNQFPGTQTDTWKWTPDVYKPEPLEQPSVSPNEVTVRSEIEARLQGASAKYDGSPVPGTFSVTGDGLDQLETDCRGQTFSFRITFTPESSNAFENVSWSSTITVINALVVE